MLHLQHDVVGHARFGQQHVHVSGQAACDGMNGEADLDAALAEVARKLKDRSLRAGYRQAIAGDNDDAARGQQALGSLVGFHLAHLTSWLLRAAAGPIGGPKAAKDYA